MIDFKVLHWNSQASNAPFRWEAFVVVGRELSKEYQKYEVTTVSISQRDDKGNLCGDKIFGESSRTMTLKVERSKV